MKNYLKIDKNQIASFCLIKVFSVRSKFTLFLLTFKISLFILFITLRPFSICYLTFYSSLNFLYYSFSTSINFSLKNLIWTWYDVEFVKHGEGLGELSFYLSLTLRFESTSGTISKGSNIRKLAGDLSFTVGR